MHSALRTSTAFAAAALTLGIASHFAGNRAKVIAADVVAPRFEVDPLWPKPLPNHWLMGQTIGVSVDATDNVWVIHRAGSLEPGELHATTKPQTAQCGDLNVNVAQPARPPAQFCELFQQFGLNLAVRRLHRQQSFHPTNRGAQLMNGVRAGTLGNLCRNPQQ